MSDSNSQPGPRTPNPEPRFSVIIPTRNRCGALELCLDALASQSRRPDEIIVVDDASTDDTPALVARFAATHPDLKVTHVRHDPQIGANPSRNRGVGEATGEIIVFTDDDCVAEPGWLEHLVAPFADEQVAATTGRTENAPARNIFELTWKGTQRVHSPDGVAATRLVGCNMAVRRDLLIEHGLDEDRAAVSADTSVSGRSDEEGLYLRLKAAGWEQRVAPDAVVLHDHAHTAGSFFRQAYRGGRAAAKLVHKYRLPPRLDLLPFVLAYATLPLVLIDWRLVAIPALFFAAALAAIAYNDLFRKRKTLGEMLLTFPVLIAYYHARLAGYVVQTIRLRVGVDRIERGGGE